MFQDGFGTRGSSVDLATGETVDVLTFARNLAAAPGFGEAVGERVARLARVRHAMYGRVRKLDRQSEDSLLMLSDRVEGWRLAEVLAVMERERLTLDFSAVLVLLRQLIPAVALFSRHQKDATIGTIGPERLILTRQGRLVVAEYVLAPGLAQLQYSRERLWRELRVAVPPTASPSRIPPSADVIGIGIVTLSLLIGRLLREDEYLVSLGELVESAAESHAGALRKLSPGFAGWLGRVLQFDEHHALRSPQEAQVAFEEMLAKERSYVTASAPLELFIERYESVVAAVVRRLDPPAAPPAVVTRLAPAVEETPRAATRLPDVSPTTDAGACPPAASPPAVPDHVLAAAQPRDTTPPDVAAPPASSVPPVAATHPPAAAAVPTLPPDPAPPPVPAVSHGRWRTVAAAIMVLALGEAVAIGWLLTREAAPSGENGELVVQSRPVAARVSVDGEERGITPFSTNLPPGSHVIEVRVGRSEPRVIPVQIRGGVQSGIYVELQSVATVGGLEVRSAPIKARVTVGGQFRGTTPLVLKDLPPGDVEVLLQSGARQVRQTVRIEPGITSQLVVPLER